MPGRGVKDREFIDKVLSFIWLGGIGNGVNRQGLRSKLAGGNVRLGLVWMIMDELG